MSGQTRWIRPEVLLARPSWTGGVACFAGISGVLAVFSKQIILFFFSCITAESGYLYLQMKINVAFKKKMRESDSSL